MEQQITLETLYQRLFQKAFINRKQLVNNSIAGMTLRLLLYPLAIPAIVFAAVSWVAHIYNFTSWSWS